MKLLLPLAALLIAATVAAPAANPDEGGEAVECISEPKTVSKVLGGKEISQVIQQIRIGNRCVWVLEGGTPERYTDADRCTNCWASGPGYSCSGPSLSMSLFCGLVRGPDCRLHSVDKEDPSQPCKPKLPPRPPV